MVHDDGKKNQAKTESPATPLLVSKSTKEQGKISTTTTAAEHDNHETPKEPLISQSTSLVKLKEKSQQQQQQQRLRKNVRTSPKLQREEVQLAVMFGSLLYNYNYSETNQQQKRKELAIVKADDDEEEKIEVTRERAFQSIFKALEKEIPTDPQHLRQSRLFQSTKKLVEFQRDQFLVGQDYAQMASGQRYKVRSENPKSPPTNSSSSSSSAQPPAASSSSSSSWKALRQMTNLHPGEIPFPPPQLPFDPNCMGHSFMANVISKQLLPLPSLRQAALPLVCKVPGWIYHPTQTALVNIIVRQESNLDRILKQQLLTFLGNPKNRTNIKASTQSILLSSSSSSSRLPAASTAPTDRKPVSKKAIHVGS